MTEETNRFPFDDIDELEREEDELPAIPEWPSIFKQSTNDN